MPRGYGSFEALIADPDVTWCTSPYRTICTARSTCAAIAKGKHVVCDKPLAMSSVEARTLLDQATRAGIVHAVTFNYRGNPLVQQARAGNRSWRNRQAALHARAVSAGLAARGYRLFVAAGARQGRRRIGPRRRRIALVRSGRAHERPSHFEVLGDLTTLERKAVEGSRNTTATPTLQTSLMAPKSSTSRSKIWRPCSCGSTTARREAFRSARCAPVTRTISCSRCAARAARWAGDRNIRTSCGWAAAIARTSVPKGRRLMDGEVRRTRACRRPSGRLGRRVLQRDARYLRSHRRWRHTGATARLRDIRGRLSRQLHGRGDSRERRGWRRLDASGGMTIQSVRPEVHESRRPDRGAAGADAARRSATPTPIAPSRTGSGFARELRRRHIQLSAALHPIGGGCATGSDARSGSEHLDLRRPFDKARARRVEAALRSTGVGTVGPRLLRQHAPSTMRPSVEEKHDFMLRVFEPPSMLGVKAVCGFVGRNQRASMDQNLVDFEEHSFRCSRRQRHAG